MDSLCHDDSWMWCNYLWDLHSEGLAYASIGTLVIYDWLVFLDQEVKLIWSRHWTPVKFLYFILRVLGMVYGITNVFNYAPRHVSDATCVAYAWIVPLSEALGFTFLQLVMILRLYAMSNRSRPLLALLLVGYSVAQGILYTDTLRNAVDIGLTTTNRHPYGYGGLCLAESGNLIEPLLRGQYASLLAFEALMLVISLIFFVKHLKQSTGMLGRCSTRNMVVVLVRDNVLYFFVTAAIFAAESLSGKEVDWAPVDHVAFDVFNGVMSGFVVGIVGPHLILSILSNHAEATRGGPSIQLADLTTVNFSGGRTGLNDPLVSYVP